MFVKGIDIFHFCKKNVLEMETCVQHARKMHDVKANVYEFRTIVHYIRTMSMLFGQVYIYLGKNS